MRWFVLIIVRSDFLKGVLLIVNLVYEICFSVWNNYVVRDLNLGIFFYVIFKRGGYL